MPVKLTIMANRNRGRWLRRGAWWYCRHGRWPRPGFQRAPKVDDVLDLVPDTIRHNFFSENAGMPALPCCSLLLKSKIDLNGVDLGDPGGPGEAN